MGVNKYDSDLLPLKYGVFATNFLLWVCLSLQHLLGLKLS